MGRLPLEGIKVLEVAAYISGPYAGAFLASLGAEVVKIEPPEGEAFRIGRDNASPYFVQYNAGKKSVAIDLKKPEGVEAVKALVPHFDVLIENMRPGKLAALGLSADVCQALNPGLVYMSVSGFGQGGQLRDRPAYDSIGQALGGLYTFMNDPDDVRLTGTCLADLISGTMTAMGVLAGLVGRERSDNRAGVRLETSVFEAVSALTIDALTQAWDTKQNPVRQTRHPQAQNFCLKTASDDFIVMHLSSSQKFWRGLATTVERPDLIEDARFQSYKERTKPEHFREIQEIMKQEFAKRPRSEWEARLTAADVPFAPALTMSEVMEHPQLEWLELLDQEPNGQTLVRPPWRFDGQRPQRQGTAPNIGEHTREVLEALLGATAADGLIERKAAFEPALGEA